MKRTFLISLFTFLFIFIYNTSILQSQEVAKYTVSGYIKDAATGEFSIGANVYIKELLKQIENLE